MARIKYELDPTLTFGQAQEIANGLWQASCLAHQALTEFVDAQGPRGSMNLTPDSVKALPEYQRLKNLSEHLFQRLRNFNGAYTKKFKKEIAVARWEQREALMKSIQEKASDQA